MEKPRKEGSQTELRCRDGKETFSEDKDNDREDRSSEKDMAKSNAPAEKYSRGDKATSSMNPGASGSPRMLHLNATKKSERRKEDDDVARIHQGAQKAHQVPCEGCQVRTLSEGAHRAHPRGESFTATPAKSSFAPRGIGITSRAIALLSVLPTAAPFALSTPESGWRRNREPSSHEFAYRSLPDTQNQQSFVGSSFQPSAA